MKKRILAIDQGTTATKTYTLDSVLKWAEK